MSLYLWINLLSISVPFIVSFHPRIQLYKHWKALFSAIFLSLIPYIIWDVYFTKSGYWGFNPDYLSGIYLFELPLGEWLFFICIPYACVFTHVSLLEIKKVELSQKVTNRITNGLLLFFVVVFFVFYPKAYTSVDMAFGISVLLLVHFCAKEILRSFYYTFLFMLVPFFVVNGVLTGTGIENEIVWYNNIENVGIRMLTIPIEDSVYAFSMILLNLFLFEKLKEYFRR